MTQQSSLEAYAHIHFLHPDECSFQLSSGSLLTLHYKDKEYHDIAIHRAFPFSHGDDYLSVRDKDGNEIGMIRSLNDFDKKTRTIIKQELERRYFVPKIQQIISIKEEFGYSYWDVSTDRGPRQFTLRRVQESVLPIGVDRLLIIDVDGNRYEIPHVQQLDSKSRRYLDTLI